MNLIELHHFLESTAIPEVKKHPKTFLGIAKQPHYENVLSNIYAFYFDENEEHGLGDLFVSCLLKLIHKQTQGDSLFLADYSVETEVRTAKGGRIDILIQSEDLAIVIENKVYHHLNNNLDDYLASVDTDRKQGVVLSLSKQSTTELAALGFINILHLDFLEAVQNDLKNTNLDPCAKYLLFLEDMYQNIVNLSNPMEKNAIDYYYSNQEKILQINELSNNLLGFIKAELDKAFGAYESLVKLPSSGGNKYRYYTSHQHPKLMITVIFEHLMAESKELTVIIELNGDLIQKTQSLDKRLFSIREKEIINQDFYSSSKDWAHFATKTYALEPENIKELSSFLVPLLEEDSFVSLFKKLIKHLDAGGESSKVGGV